MAIKKRVTSGAPWEDIVGYCRAVRVGNHISVAGTAPVDERGATFAIGDAYAQTRRCLEIIENALVEAGAQLDDVVRTRLYVTDISQWEIIGRAHGEVFRDIKPATAMVEVSGLIDPDMLVEIEAEAIISE